MAYQILGNSKLHPGSNLLYNHFESCLMSKADTRKKSVEWLSLHPEIWNTLADMSLKSKFPSFGHYLNEKAKEAKPGDGTDTRQAWGDELLLTALANVYKLDVRVLKLLKDRSVLLVSGPQPYEKSDLQTVYLLNSGEYHFDALTPLASNTNDIASSSSSHHSESRPGQHKKGTSSFRSV